MTTSQINRHFEAPPALEDAVRHFYVIQTSAGFEREVARLSPNFDMLLLLNFGASLHISFAGEPVGGEPLKDVAVLGPLKRMLNYEIQPGTDLIVTVFTLDGFYRLFRTPVENIPAEQLTDPATLHTTPWIKELWQILHNTSRLEDRIAILSNYITAYLQESETGTQPLLQGVPYFGNPAVQPVKAIARDAQLTERSIQLRFRKYTGSSPKELLRFIRFKQVLQRLQDNPSPAPDWYDIILDFGYHDQSHLIKDFQHYLGATPQQFVQQIQKTGFCITLPGKNY
ncbi:helix-turn-helix domain-containing protein [Chitinophaga solisilvae]|uniref:helix-turn-helix domain-containing protein n=1 Tax=Chitinophaga solisilvae TaxID=1233460 RepID=UPI00136D8754|nr:helix-turn-helix domain-containing protein [Chitinophaga solisilvae]